MAEVPVCPRCGNELGEIVKKSVEDAVRAWEAEGVVTDAQARQMLGGLQIGSAARRLLSPGMVLLAVGGILVVSAAVMVVAHFWEKMGGVGRSAALLVPTLGLYLTAEVLQHGGREGRRPVVLLAFLGALLVPYAVSVVSEARLAEDLLRSLFGGRNLEAGRLTLVALASLALHLATLARYRSPLLALPASGSWLFLMMSAAHWLASPLGNAGSGVAGMALLVGGVALMVAGWIAASRGQDAYAVAPDFVGSLAALLGTTMLGADLGHGWEVLAGAAPLAVIASGCTKGRQRYLFAGMLFLTVNVFRIGLEHFGDAAGLPVTLLVCGGLIIAAGLMVQRTRLRAGAD